MPELLSSSSTKSRKRLKGKVCCVCDSQHEKWTKGFLLNNEGAKVASLYFQKPSIRADEYCCNIKYLKLKKHYQSEISKKTGRPINETTSSKKRKETNDSAMQTVPLQQSLQQFQDNPNQTVEIHFPENGIKSTLVVHHSK